MKWSSCLGRHINIAFNKLLLFEGGDDDEEEDEEVVPGHALR